jgi:uncharacterized membrane protein
VRHNRTVESASLPVSPAAARRPGWSIVGVVLAALGYVASMTPSLLPRPLATQLLASVLVAMTMYAIGAIIQGTIGAIHTRIFHRPVLPRKPRLRIGASITVMVIAATATFQGTAWQREQFADTGVPGNAGNPFLVIVGTLIGCLVVLYICRGFRALGRGIATRIGRHVAWPFGARTLLGGIAVLAVASMIVVVGFAGSTVLFNNVNDSTKGQTQPDSALLSGSPESLIGWGSLGYQGRAFVSEGPTPRDISTVTQRVAVDPIRIYAGLQSAEGLAAQAEIAVADLARAGGFKRKAIIVYTPSTNGLVDPSAAAAAEYVLGGDVASISMQYTVLPSFMSIILSQSTSLDSGRILFDKVRAAVDELPANERPKVYVYGESLGAFGSQAPFQGEGIDGLTRQADGALWAGPPANSKYWQEISAMSDRGPTWQPIVDDGEVFRFAADKQGLAEPDAPWGVSRAVYLQNATDAVVWWSPDLISQRPGWLDSPRGPDVPDAMIWLPLISFELVFVDMPAAGAMPPGIGHNYLPNIGPAWVSVLAPAEWTPEDTARMQIALEEQIAAK